MKCSPQVPKKNLPILISLEIRVWELHIIEIDQIMIRHKFRQNIPNSEQTTNEKEIVNHNFQNHVF